MELSCYACGRDWKPPQARCVCGEPLWFVPDDVAWPGTGRGIWRYRDFLPVDPPGSGLCAVAGDTPLVRTDDLDAFAGCSVSVKLEGANPTGSFKDRGSAVGVAGAVDLGFDAVGTVSHGNMAMSTAAYAAAAGLDCVVLVPDDISATRLAHIGRFDPSIIRVRGDYGRLYYDALELQTDIDILFVNSDSPYRTAGQTTVALEILEARTPDAIVLPVSSGGLASATWRAFGDLERAGIVDDLPRLFVAQAAATDPITRAWNAGDDVVSTVERTPTVAYSIGNADPPSGTRTLAALRGYGGGAVSVTETEIVDAMARLASDAGLAVEPASAVPLAAARKLAVNGDLASDDSVVLVATGHGFKSTTGLPDDDPPATVPIENVPSAVIAAIQ